MRLYRKKKIIQSKIAHIWILHCHATVMKRVLRLLKNHSVVIEINDIDAVVRKPIIMSNRMNKKKNTM